MKINGKGKCACALPDLASRAESSSISGSGGGGSVPQRSDMRRATGKESRNEEASFQVSRRRGIPSEVATSDAY